MFYINSVDHVIDIYNIESFAISGEKLCWVLSNMKHQFVIKLEVGR